MEREESSSAEHKSSIEERRPQNPHQWCDSTGMQTEDCIARSTIPTYVDSMFQITLQIGSEFQMDKRSLECRNSTPAGSRGPFPMRFFDLIARRSFKNARKNDDTFQI